MDRLKKYKLSVINKLTNNYNKNISALKNKLTINIKYIHSLKIASSKKAGYIINYISNYNRVVNKLKKKLYYNIKQIQLSRIAQQSITRQNKSALLIGINYINTSNELQGCINDANIIKDFLKNKYNYKNITLLTDHTNKKPTKHNILTEFTKLMTNAISGDTIVFFYSGHGINSVDLNGYEPDGKNEFIVPLDANTPDDCIMDDELTASIQLNLKSGVTLYAIFDSCFSGTIIDLKYQYFDTLNGGNNTTNNEIQDTLGQVYLVSGCDDSQTSVDATFRVGKKIYHDGALTFAFIKTMTSSNMSFANIIENMRTFLSNENFTQMPQLSSGQSMVPNTCIFAL